MGAILRIARAVYSNSPGDPGDWSLIEKHPRSIRDRYTEDRLRERIDGAEEGWVLSIIMSEHFQPRTAREARWKLTLHMNALLALRKIRPYFAWASRGDQPQVLYAGTSLLSYLVLQLALRMSKVDGYAFCDHCGKSYEPERAPRSDRRNFCPTCPDNGISAQLADRKWREKQRIRQRHVAH
jgi:hypothetical protein